MHNTTVLIHRASSIFNKNKDNVEMVQVDTKSK
jgi:hypothetical protein